MNLFSWFMGSLRRMASILHRSPVPTPELPESPDLAPVVALISPHVPPPSRLVNELEARLRSMEVEEEGQWPGLSIPVPSRAMGLGISALIVLATVGVLVALYGLRTREAQASPLQRAYTSLLSLESLSYRVRGDITPGVCGLLFNAPLTAEERESLKRTTGSDSAVGNVITCQKDAEIDVEQGEYDLVNRAFKARVERKTLGQNLGPDVSAALSQPQERIYVDGTLYAKDGDGPWRVQERDAAWAPFVVGGFGQIPSGRLDVLTEQYDTVEALPDAAVDGEKLKHFRATRKSPGTGVIETAEAWIGDDGIPRRVVTSLGTPFSIDEYLAPSLNAARRGFEDPTSPSYAYRNLPFVKRGDIQDVRTVEWTYEFNDFNEPVDITAPIVDQGGSAR
ncbi:MAG: hypothetical protein HY682_09435 [Chloroflexi bacterium]|nr:hypothetical protein [Chloroflexota bacterium]